jgi:hypothetical protein
LSGISRDPKLFSSIGGMLYLLERVTHYLGLQECVHAWKVVTDGKFDPNAVSTQCGAAPILKMMIDWMIVRL